MTFIQNLTNFENTVKKANENSNTFFVLRNIGLTTFCLGGILTFGAYVGGIPWMFFNNLMYINSKEDLYYAIIERDSKGIFGLIGLSMMFLVGIQVWLIFSHFYRKNDLRFHFNNNKELISKGLIYSITGSVTAFTGLTTFFILNNNRLFSAIMDGFIDIGLMAGGAILFLVGLPLLIAGLVRRSKKIDNNAIKQKRIKVSFDIRIVTS